MIPPAHHITVAGKDVVDTHVQVEKKCESNGGETMAMPTKSTENRRDVETKNLPERKFRAGVISATVWKNIGTTKEGQLMEYRTVSFERGYKDRDGEWKSTSSLRVNDLPRAALVLQKAYEYVALKNLDEEAQVV